MSSLLSRVALAIEDRALAEQLARRIADTGARPDLSRLIELVALEAAPDLRIASSGGRLVIQDPSGTPLVAPFSADALEGLASALAHIARFRNGVGLRNPDPDSGLAGKVTLDILRLKRDALGSFVAGADGHWETEPAPLDAVGNPVLTAIPEPDDWSLPLDPRGDCVAFRVASQHRQPVHVALLNFGPSWSVHLILPSGGIEAAIPPDGPPHIVGNRPGEEIPVVLSPDMPEGREIWKLIAMLSPRDCSALEQSALKPPQDSGPSGPPDLDAPRLHAFSDRTASPGSEAAFRPWIPPSDDWAAIEIEGRSVLHADFAGHSLVPGSATSLDGGLRIAAPLGFKARARLLAAEGATRAVDGQPAAPQAPPALAPFGQWFQPIALGGAASRDAAGTGAAGGDAVAIELSGDQAVWGAVTAERPLRLELPDQVDEGEGVLAVAHDGELFFPVGRLGDDRGSLEVTWLPAPLASDADAGATRDLKGSIRLYLFKVANLPLPELGLFRSRFLGPAELAARSPAPDERVVVLSDGELRYAPPRPGDLEPGQRAALFVHGFSSDSRWMARGVVDWLRQNGVAYDHVLTYDYETMGTPIADNGKDLAEQLQGAGFGPEDGVTLDVFAHSMGTQVARSMAELYGGHAFVDRLFLAGPPNEGTSLAGLKRPAIWILSLLLNQAGPTPPSALAIWALKKVGDRLPGIDDLRPGSELYARLNAPGAQRAGLYHVLIGDNSDRPAARSAWERAAGRLSSVADRALDRFFQSPNDLVISVTSAESLSRLLPDERLKRRVVPCDHFGYFVTGAAQEQLLDWLKA